MSDQEDERPVEEPKSVVQSHGDAMREFQDGIAHLISHDIALSYLPSSISLEEARLQLALHQGKAVTVFLRKLDNSTMPIPVMQGSRVVDLKRSIRLHMGSQLHRAGKTMPVSWKYVWKTYHLAAGQSKLTDDNALLLNCGIGNRSEVTFIKKLRREHKGKSVRARTDG